MHHSPSDQPQPAEKTFLGHPTALFVLFGTEMWERMCYYGMRALLMLYMTQYLMFSEERAGGVYGNYTGLVYLMPLFGGIMADRYLGLRRSILIGGILMAVGEGFLTIGMLASFYLGLCLLIVGNGFFKPNISTLVGQLYAPDDPRRDGAFTIFYMGINLGAFLAPLICGSVGQSWSPGHEVATQVPLAPGATIDNAFQSDQSLVLEEARDIRFQIHASQPGVETRISIGSKFVTGEKPKMVSTTAPSSSNAYDFLGRGDAGDAVSVHLTNTGKNETAVSIKVLVGRQRWHWGFGLAGIGMVFGLLNFVIFGRALGDKGLKPVHATMASHERQSPLTAREKGWLAGVLATGVGLSLCWGGWILFRTSDLGAAIQSLLWPLIATTTVAIWVYLMGRTHGVERGRVNAIFVIGVFVMVFWAAFEQAGTSMTLFADRYTRLSYFGRTFASSLFQSANPLYILLLAPLFSMIWTWLSVRGKDPSTSVKMAIGILLNGIGFGVMFLAAFAASQGERVSPNWLMAAYFLQTCGELCLSPVGLAMVTRLAPARFAAMLMGVWFLSSAFANKLAGMVGGQFENLQPTSLFGSIAAVLIVTAVILTLLVPWLKRLMGGVK